ncbi:hypothetical protein BDI4_300078 [Burkholderia diffusa]|nr:hypothetical protein BDI4_300078 [Burkholderia diffusa]
MQSVCSVLPIISSTRASPSFSSAGSAITARCWPAAGCGNILIDSADTAGADAGPAAQAAAVVTQKAARTARIANFIDVLLINKIGPDANTFVARPYEAVI